MKLIFLAVVLNNYKNQNNAYICMTVRSLFSFPEKFQLLDRTSFGNKRLNSEVYLICNT